MIPKEEYIIGNKFVELGDYQITTNDFIIDESKLIGNQILFCKTDKIRDLFSILRNLPDRKFIIISHNSDINVDEELYSLKPNNVLHWFAQNVIVLRSDITPIPIGLENPGVGGSSNYSLIESVSNLQIEYVNSNAYCNISPTNIKERTFNRDKSYITNVYDRLSFQDYLIDVKKHRFIISPPGNGLDCHRTWEALYLGSIPIVKRSVTTEFMSRYCNMIIVDDFNELSDESSYQQRTEGLRQENSKILRFSYWKNIIDLSKSFNGFV